MNFNGDNTLPVNKQKPSKYFLTTLEMGWMAAEGYEESKEVILRKVAMREILRCAKCYKLEPLIPYLALNFFDRFISRHQLPNVLGRVRDDIALAANSCVTIAWRRRDESLTYDEFLDKRYQDKDSKERIGREIKILRMELEILNGLGENMHVVTPIEYVEFFVGMIPIGKGIKLRTINEIIIQTQGDISFTRFLPSVIAASALLTACRFLYKNLYDRKNLFRVATEYVNEEDLEACLEETYKLCIAKKILLERDVGFEESRKLEVGAAEMTQLGETLSSISNGAEEEPMQDQTKNEPQGKIDPEMNFELKWLMWISEDPEEWTINSPDFRTPDPIPDDPDEGRVEARNYFGNIYDAVISPFKSCVTL